MSAEPVGLELRYLLYSISAFPPCQEGAALPLGGAWPLTIQWTHGLHPAERLPDQGLRLERLEIAGAGAAGAQAALGAVAGPVVFSPGDGTPGDGLVRLSAAIRTPGGVVTL